MAIEFKDGKYVDETGHVTLDPTVYKDWQIAAEAEKTLPSVEYFREKLGLLPDEIIPYGKTPKMDFIKEKAVTTPFKRFKDIFTDDDFVYEKTVRALDIDQSHHTNNVKYCMMILDTFSVKELESMTIKELEICYESESLEGDTLRIYRKEIDNGWQFAIKRDGKTITSAFIGL